jgi:hypothetical protein
LPSAPKETPLAFGLFLATCELLSFFGTPFVPLLSLLLSTELPTQAHAISAESAFAVLPAIGTKSDAVAINLNMQLHILNLLSKKTVVPKLSLPPHH